MLTRIALVLSLCTAPLLGQAGDGNDKEKQPEVWKTMNVPPAPVVPPEEALKTFRIAPGFRIELVAAEPLVQDPVAIAWDADGRLWVVEMRGYMPNVDGKGEDARIGRVSVLEDDDNDGKMDRSTVFLDGLQMPRALSLVDGGPGNAPGSTGVLVAEPPILWYCRDTNGDLKCDEKIEVLKGYGSQGPVEHTDNGLMRGLDNWIYSAKSSKRMKFALVDGKPKLTVEDNVGRGQWGITQDNYGRLYHNSNSNYLSVDLIPPEYLRRNPHFPLRGEKGIASDQAVHSIRVNPGVNRGYQPSTLRPDGRLKNTTATCGPGVYRGHQFPAEYIGNLFIPEPAGNVVAHFAIEEKDGSLKAIHKTYDDPQWKQREFLASTDERFRPVNAYTGPDGALYIVDLYRGILQHKVYVTTFLRKQIIERELDKHLHLGRIYRIVAEKPREGWKPARPRLSKATDDELIEMFEHPNGWWRDMAQRLLIERNTPQVQQGLRAGLYDVAATLGSPLARIHALWTLAGLSIEEERRVDFYTLSQAVQHKDVKVVTHAMRISEAKLNAKLIDPSYEVEQRGLMDDLLAYKDDPRVEVRRQLAFTLAGVKLPSAATALRELALKHCAETEMREAILSGLHQRELEFLQRLLADPAWDKHDKGREAMVRDLAVCVTTEMNPARIGKLVDLAGAQKGEASWRAKAILEGISTVAFPKGRAPKPLYYDTQPKGMAELAKHEDKAVRELAAKAGEFIRFGAPPPPAKPATPLTAAQQKQFDSGKVFFGQTCAACHQATGLGEEGKAPPLIDSPYLLGDPSRTIRIVLHGVAGPITLHGRTYNMEMPPLKGFTDEQIAAILTYARREWEHAADPVDADTVTKVREATKEREAAWSEEELKKVK